jgi:hypothetical protein
MISKIIFILIGLYIGLFVIVFCFKQLCSWIKLIKEDTQNTPQVNTQQYVKPEKRKNMRFNKNLGVWEME